MEDQNTHHHTSLLHSPLIEEELEDERFTDTEDRAEFFGFKSFNWGVFWRFCGPGWLMSIAYLDPGNIEADLQQGVVAGYSLLWILLLATCLGLFLQILAARLGVVTGKQLAQVCREQYPFYTSIFLWIMTEVAIIGSDIQEVVGSAIALQVLFGLPLWVGVSLTAVDSFFFLALDRFGVGKLESFFLVLVGAMAMSFGYVFFASNPDWSGIAYGTFVPTIAPGQDNINVAVAMVGAVVMPHNIFLHSALVQSRNVNPRLKNKVTEANFYFALESSLALILSFIINLFVVSVFAKTYHDFSGDEADKHCVIPDINGDTVDILCSDIGLKEAGGALFKVLGPAGRIVWGIGLLASGQSSTMTGTYAGQFVMEGFLNLKISKFKRTLFTRSVALVPAMLVAILCEAQLDNLDEYLNLLQSVQLPFAILPVIRFTSSVAIMGVFANTFPTQIIAWLCALLVMVINVYGLTLQGFDTVVVVCGAIFYCLVIFGVGFTGLKREENGNQGNKEEHTILIQDDNGVRVSNNSSERP